jgi:hypothetical protein
VTPAGEKLPARLTGFSNAPEIEIFLDLISQLGRVPETQNGAFELRVLRIPWLHMEAFWLHSDKDDFVVPYSQFSEEERLKPSAKRWSDFQKENKLNIARAQDLHTRRGARILAARAEAAKEQAELYGRRASAAARQAALSQVLANMKEATPAQIGSALELDKREAELVHARCAENDLIRSVEELLKKLDLEPALQEKLNNNKEKIGFGYVEDNRDAATQAG